MSGVQLDIMLLVPELTIIGILTVPHVIINQQTLIIPVIQHHQPCMRWKATVHGHVTQIIIKMAHRAPHVLVFHSQKQGQIQNLSLVEHAHAVNHAHVIVQPVRLVLHHHRHVPVLATVVLGHMATGHILAPPLDTIKTAVAHVLNVKRATTVLVA